MDKDKETELVQMIMRQTDYTEVVAREKLIENNYIKHIITNTNKE